MVKHCVSSKYSGPTCYDITEGESKIMKTLTIALLVGVLILIVIGLISYTREDKNKLSEHLGFRVVGMFVFAMFLILILYQFMVTSKSKVLCRGYFDCDKI